MKQLRFGILGAARIAPRALIRPAKTNKDVAILGIAARDLVRAQALTKQYQIPQAYDDYATLLANPNINVIYNPLPNSHHHEWTLKALAAGKHVLCEKPLASNTQEAEELFDAAHKNRLVLAEAFHNLYHPLTAKMKSIIDSGVLGTIRKIDAQFCTMVLRPRDIRYRYDLAGGATMDLGCYCISLMRYLTGCEPTVVSAQASQLSADPEIDRTMDVYLRFSSNMTTRNPSVAENCSARMRCALISKRLYRISLKVEGDLGTMKVINPVLPFVFHLLRVQTKRGRTRQFRMLTRSTYAYQLDAFVRAVQNGETLISNPKFAIGNMRVIDDIYRQAGMRLRGANKRSDW
ncbi:Gfo/Idh/MocA family oxidoreductase [Chloroflexi bacterium TSY]|nr:Gfo/Idh/MocA family oxidoreductase [Chloroflexi bacterium TSY]